MELLVKDSFYEFAAILILAAFLGGIGQLLKQPLIVMFIALGIIVGPAALNLVQSKEKIQLLAEIGISVLLFIVGLKLDLRLIRSTGKISVITGLGQVIFTSGIGFVIALLLGIPPLQSFYVAVALTFSSTIIIVKLLSDKKEIDSLHGQIAIGFLIVQDMVVILVMIILSAFEKGGNTTLLYEIATTLLKGTILIALVFVISKWVIPSLSYFLAKSHELLTLFAIAWAITLASISEIIGFSGEVGAFLAGISLASSPFKEHISSRLVSLRDFLLLFFFVNLGADLNLSVIKGQIPEAIIFSLFVLLGNPLIVLIIMGMLGYRKRTAFLAGLTVAQISEFSLIFAGLGLQMGHLNQEIVSLITLVGLITIGTSTYMILYSHYLFSFLSPILSIFEKKDPNKESKEKLNEQQKFDIILFGLGRFGSNIAKQLEKKDLSYLAIDFDPQKVINLQKGGKSIIYGDLEDPDILERIPYHHAKCIVSTIPDFGNSVQLAKTLKRKHYKGEVMLTLRHIKDAEMLKNSSLAEVLMPHKMAAENFYNIHIKRIFRDIE